MIHIGTCGWVYQDWKGGFYPQHISSEEMSPAYAETFQTVEVNNTFYQLPDADAVYDLLTQSGSAFCVHDHRDAPSPQQVTSAFVYVRFHGPRGDYGGRYPPEELADWAATLADWQDEGRDVYGYFNNDDHGYAVENAKELEALLSNASREARRR